ncbi:tetraacyldisaccharide 4'-kinase [Simiduia sp. 21SJ11W-1]|uniref:tetraacyldisaccharide 4'-kinase n=1 Tax=Simiduia sp. 21SJ11W-1 TaxID=2909669 RepID=UPI00209E8006|nr:tetraacyldisaccharide 4'-kinase [Simiduia sp. 21SJ11W-1]UTA49439.1 tetraacyldisaccharide 4'-kinase [Simiduia sp. 21SJ11W-1]
MQAFMLKAWYEGGWRSWVTLPLLWPLSVLLRAVAAIRRRRQQAQAQAHAVAGVPVIIVGNISVGGTGKTPLIEALAQSLQQAGWRPGIVSRGYGGQGPFPLLVSSNTSAQASGDEPKMLYERTGLPLVVAPDRPLAVQHLLSQANCNVILSDDGLQHYRLHRDLEIIVLDGSRGLGNGRLLPAGPLRETPARLGEADLLVINAAGPLHPSLQPWAHQSITMTLKAHEAVNVATGERRPIGELPDCHWAALCGIGNPARFYHTLDELNLRYTPHSFPDHHAYTEQELQAFTEKAVLMTEKDAVKCHRFAGANWWFIKVAPTFSRDIKAQLTALLNALENPIAD